MRETDQGRMMTFRSGGWVLLAAGVFALAVFVWAISGALLRRDTPVVGDGRNVETYGFDMRTCLVQRELIVAGGLRKDALEALVDPPVIPGGEVARINEQAYGKYLVSRDRVIGVVIGGEARAYPLLIMKVHEIANDALGGVPIAVTYSPLCDAVAVFDRRVEGAVLEFGVSGLLFNSNLLMYDRQPGGTGESLWSQLKARAITGPAAEARTRLEPLDAQLVTWADWLAAHPRTTVLEPDPRMARRYKETQYDTYFVSEKLMFPVQPLPPAGGPDLKDRVVAVFAGGRHAVYSAGAIARRAAADGTWSTTLGDTTIRFRVRETPEAVTAGTSGADATMYAFWFAWYATHPADRPALP